MLNHIIQIMPAHMQIDIIPRYATLFQPHR